MSDIVNKADPSIFKLSANEANFPQADWLWDPPGLATLHPSVPSRHWKLNGGGTDIVEMTAGEKTVVDDAAATSLATQVHAQLTTQVDGDLPVGVDVRSLIQLMNKRDNFLTTRIIELQNRVQAMLDSTGGVANMRTDGLAVSISATATRPRSDAIQDYKDDIDAGVND